jgi:hypothetical protein
MSFNVKLSDLGDLGDFMLPIFLVPPFISTILWWDDYKHE